jgi:hypothetical protein
MRCARSDAANAGRALAAAAITALIGAAAIAPPHPSSTADASVSGDAADAAAIVRAADAYRGLARPYRFLARIGKRGVERAGEPRDQAAAGTASPAAAGDVLAEVRSDGFTRQLVFVLAPTRGDVILRSGDVTWLRPRRLHRLTRLPADLRMFNGAAISDVTSVDVLRGYDAVLRAPTCSDDGRYVLELDAGARQTRYPRALYEVECATLRPYRIQFMSRSGAVLKTVTYTRFAPVLGATIATRLAIEDRIFRDVTMVDMSAFEALAARDSEAFTPSGVLALPDVF